MRLRRSGQKRSFDPERCRECGRTLKKGNVGADLGDGSFLCWPCFNAAWRGIRSQYQRSLDKRSEKKLRENEK